MNRKCKNTILGCTLALLIAAAGFTVYKAGSSKSSDLKMPSENNIMQMPDSSENLNSKQSQQSSENKNQSEQSQQNSENENQDEQGQSDSRLTNDKNEQNTNQLEKTNNQSTDARQSPPDSGNSNGAPSAPPENNLPGQNNNGDNGTGGFKNDQNGFKPDDVPGSQNDTGTKTIYYVLIGIESAAAAAVIIYMIMSKFNKLSFKETFKNSDKTIIMILSTVILTAALTFSASAIINCFKSSASKPLAGGNQNNNSVSYSAATELSSDEDYEESGKTYSSSKSDENAILATGTGNITLSDITVDKSGSSDGGDTTSFYGTNSAILAKDKANLTIKNAKITTNATGANGVFCFGGQATTNNAEGDGTTINISDSVITTSADNSGGIMTTGGGIMNAENLTVSTSGTSSAAIRTDRGGGKVTVNSGNYETRGKGSPVIYSTADVTVNNATLVSKASEGVVIEGKNSVTLNGCNLTDSNTKLNGQSTTYKNIFLYQSMSGDAAEGSSKFTAKNSKIVTNNGDSFYVTNTDAVINLENNEIINNDSAGAFLRIQKDSWGTSGKNGGSAAVTLKNQKISGDIVVDNISSLNLSLSSASYYEGTLNGDNTAESVTLKLDASSKIKLTGNCYVTSFSDDDETLSNIDFNGFKLFVNGTSVK